MRCSTGSFELCKLEVKNESFELKNVLTFGTEHPPFNISSISFRKTISSSFDSFLLYIKIIISFEKETCHEWSRTVLKEFVKKFYFWGVYGYKYCCSRREQNSLCQGTGFEDAHILPQYPC